MQKQLKLGLILSAAVLMVACGGRSNIESDLGIRGAPDWVNEGTQAVNDKKGRFIQGVGMSAPLGDMSLQNSTADGRARAEIARVLSTHIDSTLNDYTASAGGQVDASVEREIKSVTQLALSGAKVIARWKNPKNGDVYSFAELDMKKVEQHLQTAGKFGEYYKQQAAAGFDRFVQEK